MIADLAPGPISISRVSTCNKSSDVVVKQKKFRQNKESISAALDLTNFQVYFSTLKFSFFLTIHFLALIYFNWKKNPILIIYKQEDVLKFTFACL